MNTLNIVATWPCYPRAATWDLSILIPLKVSTALAILYYEQGKYDLFWAIVAVTPLLSARAAVGYLTTLIRPPVL